MKQNRADLTSALFFFEGGETVVGYMPMIYILALIGAFFVITIIVKLLFKPFIDMKEKDDERDSIKS